MAKWQRDKVAECAGAVNRLVPFVHVIDVDASVGFYELLGFVALSVMKDPQGRAFWAMLKSGGAEIMLARASGPVDAEQQAVILYMYSTDVGGLREHLLACGLGDAGRYSGAKSPDDGPGRVYEVAHPQHMPEGELRVSDPDGYCILVGQLG